MFAETKKQIYRSNKHKSDQNYRNKFLKVITWRECVCVCIYMCVKIQNIVKSFYGIIIPDIWYMTYWHRKNP